MCGFWQASDVDVQRAKAATASNKMLWKTERSLGTFEKKDAHNTWANTKLPKYSFTKYMLQSSIMRQSVPWHEASFGGRYGSLRTISQTSLLYNDKKISFYHTHWRRFPISDNEFVTYIYMTSAIESVCEAHRAAYFQTKGTTIHRNLKKEQSLALVAYLHFYTFVQV